MKRHPPPQLRLFTDDRPPSTPAPRTPAAAPVVAKVDKPKRRRTTTAPRSWEERLDHAFGLDYRTRGDLIREARLTPGEVAAAERWGRLPRSPTAEQQAADDLADMLEILGDAGQLRGGRSSDGSYYSPIGVHRTIVACVGCLLAASIEVPDVALAIALMPEPEPGLADMW